MGSGTTAVASIMENRHYIGIEKEQKYVYLANEACDHAFQDIMSLKYSKMKNKKYNKHMRKDEFL